MKFVQRFEGDPFGGRQPTSHERMTGLPWDASYHGGRAPWDIGRAQPAIVRLASDHAFSGTVLDAGCGTGENALYIASHGLPVVGVDVADTALTIAREKAERRALDATFLVCDAFALHGLGRLFDSVLDCGLFPRTFCTPRSLRAADGASRPSTRKHSSRPSMTEACPRGLRR